MNWVGKRYNWSISEQWIIPSAGVVTALATAIQTLTEEHDQILVQTPVYPPFFNTIEKNNRKVVFNPLLLNDGRYEINFVDFEEKLKNGVKVFILCNPHNPVGRVWTRDELVRMAELCEKYDVYIISDEIHADIIYKPNVHTPIASIDERYQKRTITALAPSKTFNIPGLQSSFMVIPNHEIMEKVKSVQEKMGFHGLNLFGNVAIEAAYKHGEYWLETLLPYLKRNVEYVKNYLEEEMPNVRLIEPEGTYLLWIDCRGLGLTDDEIKEKLVKKGKLALEPGPKYGVEGSGFVRMNIGCPLSLVEEGMRRFKTAFS